ncbi:hypothetical protein AAC387_Pa07g3009 [Persea americana]
MGIQDLLRFLKPFVEYIHIQKYAGKRVGIDAYSWLHKGAYSCSMNLCLYPGSEKASRYLEYFMHRINLLRHYNVTPVVVFDGGDIPCKSATSNERQRRREANLSLAKENLKQGNVNAAHDYFQKSVCITPSVAYPLIQILRSEGVEFVVAPYEADAQLAYLSTLEEEQGGISAVITEDSDLMAYNCPAVIFKMDRYGKGEEILLDKVFTSVLCGLSFRHFDKKLFTGMCVLAGCDFLPSVPGIGIKRAYTYVSKYRNLDRVLSMLKYEKSSQMPEDYFKSFREAITVFHHARIYDPDTKSLKPMKPLPVELIQSLENDLDFLGPEVPPSIASAIAEGRIDPITMEAFDYFPATKFHVDTVKTDAPDHPPRPKVQMVLKQQSCFTIFAAQKTEHEKITDSLDGRMYSTEAAALEKLIAPPKLPQKEVIEVDRGKIPDNNPFKRKMIELSSERKLSTSEQVSGVTNFGELDDTACATPDSQKSVGSKPAKNAKH